MFYKDEVVKMMTEKINAMNKEVFEGMGMWGPNAEQAIAQQQTELNRVNGMLYDLLKENGVIP
jgi:hypothetical protein